jgi:hypothetical protein
MPTHSEHKTVQARILKYAELKSGVGSLLDSSHTKNGAGGGFCHGPYSSYKFKLLILEIFRNKLNS